MNGLTRRLNRRRAADPEDPAGGSGGGEAEPAGHRSLLEDPGATQPIPLEEAAALARQTPAEAARPQRSGQDLPAGLDEDELAARPESSARRGRIRRRVRFLLAARELLLRDLGGFVYEIQRTAGSLGEGHASLRDRKVERLESIDRELDDLRRRLGDPLAPAVLRQPGVGGECPVCGDLFASDQEFCGRDGTPLTRNAQRSREREVEAAIRAREADDAGRAGEAATDLPAAAERPALPPGGTADAAVRPEKAEAPTVIERPEHEPAGGRRRSDDR